MSKRTLVVPMEWDFMRDAYTFQVAESVVREFIDTVKRGAASADDPYDVEFEVVKTTTEWVPFEEFTPTPRMRGVS